MSFTNEELGEVIDNAIVNEHVIAFLYEKKIGDRPEPRMLSPYECSDNGETVLGYDHHREELRRFELSKIIAIETTHKEDYIKPIEKEAV
jgi:predicted DNA-binding transcriptional regulator YafY